MKNNDINKTIADRITYLRLNICQMTQTEFAEALGSKHQHVISDYERGVIKPGLSRCKMMIKLAAKFKKQIDLNWLRPDL